MKWNIKTALYTFLAMLLAITISGILDSHLGLSFNYTTFAIIIDRLGSLFWFSVIALIITGIATIIKKAKATK